MSHGYNFSAGPAMLPQAVLLKAQSELLNWQGSGVSIMEIGHRTLLFQELITQLEHKLRQLLNIPSHYKVLFLTGGGQGHFSFIPMNLTDKNSHVDYLVTGFWSQKAAQYATRYACVHQAATPLPDRIAPPEQWQLDPNAAYVYYCPNETIQGIQFPDIPIVNTPLIADMTSCILSEPIDINQFGLIFAAAQKNLGIAGITLLIIRDDLLDRAQSIVPELFHYQAQSIHGSLLNTVPIFPIYIMDLMINWLLDTYHDLSRLQIINSRKAAKLYHAIDNSQGFYTNTIQTAYRSKVNVPFNLPNQTLLKKFLEEAQQHGLQYLQGHRLMNNIRASLYNAMPEEGVDQLIAFMHAFQTRYAHLAH